VRINTKKEKKERKEHGSMHTFASDDDARKRDPSPIAGIERAPRESQVAVDVGDGHDRSLGTQIFTVKDSHQEIQYALNRRYFL
jgi:hypothetical protein